MAATRTPARRRTTTARKRATTKKGLSTTAKLAIGVGAAAGIYLIWDQFFNKAKKEAAAAAAAGTTDAAQNVIDAAQNTEPNILPEPKRQLSPKGTPSKNLKWNSIRLYYGDKGGEIEEMQKQFNAVSKLYNQPQIKIDGIWGPKTEEKKLVIMGTGKGFTLMDVYNEYKANVEGQKGYKEIVKDLNYYKYMKLPDDLYTGGNTKYTRALYKWNKAGQKGDYLDYVTD